MLHKQPKSQSCRKHYMMMGQNLQHKAQKQQHSGKYVDIHVRIRRQVPSCCLSSQDEAKLTCTGKLQISISIYHYMCNYTCLRHVLIIKTLGGAKLLLTDWFKRVCLQLYIYSYRDKCFPNLLRLSFVPSQLYIFPAWSTQLVLLHNTQKHM